MTTYAIQMYTVKDNAWKLSEYSLGDTFSQLNDILHFTDDCETFQINYFFFLITSLRSVLSIHNGFLYNILQLYLIKE